MAPRQQPALRNAAAPGFRSAIAPAAIALLCCVAALGVSGCGTGDFDQQLRGDIDELRESASISINTNPGIGEGQVTGFATNGGPIADARVELFGINDDGTLASNPDQLLGNSITDLFDGEFRVTLRSAYAGPLLVRLTSTTFNGRTTSVPNPANANSAAEESFGPDDELWGFIPDFPGSTQALIVTPLTHLAVARARHLGGLSSGNLVLASRQVGQFFNLRTTRDAPPTVLTSTSATPGPIASDLIFCAISQLARMATVPQANVWRAMAADIDDDGDLNGTSGLIPGSDMALPDLGAPDYIATVLLEQGFLADGNLQNQTRYSLDLATPGSALRNALDALDSDRSLEDYTQVLGEVSLQFPILQLKPGQSSSVGVRGFTRIDGNLLLVASSDGPTVASLTLTSDDPAIASIDGMNRIAVSPAAQPGQSTRITVRVQPDGTHLSGTLDETLSLLVRVVAP